MCRHTIDLTGLFNAIKKQELFILTENKGNNGFILRVCLKCVQGIVCANPP